MDNHLVLLAIAGTLALLTLLGVVHEHLATDPNRRRRVQPPAMARLGVQAAIAHDERRAMRSRRRRR